MFVNDECVCACLWQNIFCVIVEMNFQFLYAICNGCHNVEIVVRRSLRVNGRSKEIFCAWKKERQRLIISEWQRLAWCSSFHLIDSIRCCKQYCQIIFLKNIYAILKRKPLYILANREISARFPLRFCFNCAIVLHTVIPDQKNLYNFSNTILTYIFGHYNPSFRIINLFLQKE